MEAFIKAAAPSSVVALVTAIVSYTVFRMKRRYDQVRQTQEKVVTQLDQFAARMEILFKTNQEALETAIGLLFKRFESAMQDMTAQRQAHANAMDSLMTSQGRMINTLETRNERESERADLERVRRAQFMDLSLELGDVAEDLADRLEGTDGSEIKRLRARLREARRAHNTLLASLMPSVPTRPRGEE